MGIIKHILKEEEAAIAPRPSIDEIMRTVAARLYVRRNLQEPSGPKGGAGKGGAGVGGAGCVCFTCGETVCLCPVAEKGGAGKGGAGVVCFTCGEPGHKSPDCPRGADPSGPPPCKWCALGECWSHGQESKGKGGAGVVCYTCGEPGHKSPDCPRGAISPPFLEARGNGKGGAGVVCYTCGEPGHKSPDCPEVAISPPFLEEDAISPPFAEVVQQTRPTTKVYHNRGKPGQKRNDGFQAKKGSGTGRRSGLRNFATEQKVWLGGLPADFTVTDMNSALKEHMAQVGDCQCVEIGKTGSGGAAFSTADEALNAICLLNGTEFAGVEIQVDAWTKN